MKKIIAILLAAVIALSCSAMAFAEDPTTTTTQAPQTTEPAPYECGECHARFQTQQALQDHYSKYHCLTCPYCGNVFTNQQTYNEHIQVCKENHPTQIDPADISINSLLHELQKFFELTNINFDSETWRTFSGDISGLIAKIFDLVQLILNSVLSVNETEVLGAVDSLDEKLLEAGLFGDIYATFKNIIESLKQKIKALYANSAAELETEAEALAETGSGAAGVIAFAAVSAAAAAAYVCTKKRD